MSGNDTNCQQIIHFFFSNEIKIIEHLLIENTQKRNDKNLGLV